MYLASKLHVQSIPRWSLALDVAQTTLSAVEEFGAWLDNPTEALVEFEDQCTTWTH